MYEGFCEGAWQDDLIGSRNVLEIFEKFGGRSCWDGYEGTENEMDRFTTCHLTIVERLWCKETSHGESLWCEETPHGEGYGAKKQ